MDISPKDWIAAQAWFMAALISNIAVLPLVIPCPYIAISKEPLGYTFALDSSKAFVVICSSVEIILLKLISNYLLIKSTSLISHVV